VSALVRLYPAAWRARYGVEFEALLVERPPSARDVFDIAMSALDARLSPQLQSAVERHGAGWGARLAGGAAIAGGLAWSVTFMAAMLDTAGTNWTLPILGAVILTLLSLPGRYLSAYVRPVAVGIAAVGLSLAAWITDAVPWGLIVLVPVLAVTIVLGPGALALAAARAGVGPRDRWRLVLLTTPWPVIAGILTSAGLLPDPISTAAMVITTFPICVAWILIGARVARGAPVDGGPQPPVQPDSTMATAGGAA
jgi:hypothetical protein